MSSEPADQFAPPPDQEGSQQELVDIQLRHPSDMPDESRSGIAVDAADNPSEPTPPAGGQLNEATINTNIERQKNEPLRVLPIPPVYGSFREFMRSHPLGHGDPIFATQLVEALGAIGRHLDTLENEYACWIANRDATLRPGPPPRQANALVDNPDLEIKFFKRSDSDFGLDGRLNTTSTTPGAFTSSLPTDGKQFIRALYQPTETARSSLSADTFVPGITPEPDSIDIIALAICSNPLRAFFDDELNLPSGNSTLRLQAPFRPLIENMGTLRDHLARLEKKKEDDAIKSFQEITDPYKTMDSVVEAVSNPSSSQALGDQDLIADSQKGPTAAPSKDAQKRPVYESKAALTHFKMLVDFVDQYLARSVRLYQGYAQGKENKVVYENLWMLFGHDTTLYCPHRSSGQLTYSIEADNASTTSVTSVAGTPDVRPQHVPQAYRVIDTKGGVPALRMFMSAGHSEDDIWNDPSLLKFTGQMYNSDGLSNFLLGPSGGASGRRSVKINFCTLYVACFSIEFDGTQFGTVRNLFEFEPFEGEKDVRDLEAFPIQYLSEEENNMLLMRGRKFLDATYMSHMSYDGMTLGSNHEEINGAVMIDFKTAFSEYSGALPAKDAVRPNFTALEGWWPDRGLEVPEFQEHRARLHRNRDEDTIWCQRRHCNTDAFYDYREALTRKMDKRMKLLLNEIQAVGLKQGRILDVFREFLEVHDFVRILPGVVPGFALRNRRWVYLDSALLHAIIQVNEWKRLVLTDGHKEMIQAMVEAYTNRSDVGQRTGRSSGRVDMDLVHGKGKGCIILLHGAPGVGKTSTAECVAAYLKRPLYPITCGDVGYIPEDVEKNMEEHFRLAHRWGCVLLLDEADVFLAKRNKQDVKRNGLVSVFLRILEYYSGILFLTTNRVGAIDDAFRSRLHLTLYYPKLTKDQTRKIWKNNLSRLIEINDEREAQGQPQIRFNKHEIMKWAKRHAEDLQWNGRQIRNAFQTAVALAEFQTKYGSKKRSDRAASEEPSPTSPALKAKHFMKVAEASMEFNDYLRQTHGVDEDTMASKDQVRLANFKSTPKVKKMKKESWSDSDTDSDASIDTNQERETGGSRLRSPRVKHSESSQDSSSDASNSNSSLESVDSAKKKKRKNKKGKKTDKSRE